MDEERKIIDKMIAYLNDNINFQNQAKQKYDSEIVKAHCEGAAMALEMAKDHLEFLVRLYFE